jgi:UbiD family decarboxylase
MGQAVEVIRGPITGLPFPANAEIVVEGFATNDEMLPEGPFGEWTGYYASGERVEPVLKVEAVYFRNDPIIHGSPPGRPPDELSRYRAPLRSALLYEELAKAGMMLGAYTILASAQPVMADGLRPGPLGRVRPGSPITQRSSMASALAELADLDLDL